MDQGEDRAVTKTLYALAVLLLAGTVGGLFLDIEADVLVPVGASGLLIFLFAELRAWWRRGMSPGRLEAIFGCLGLLCGVVGYYFHHHDIVLLSCVGGFFLCMILIFAAQIWGKMRETRELTGRYRDWRDQKRVAKLAEKET